MIELIRTLPLFCAQVVVAAQFYGQQPAAVGALLGRRRGPSAGLAVTPTGMIIHRLCKYVMRKTLMIFVVPHKGGKYLTIDW